MKTFIRLIPRLTRRSVGVVALLLGTGAAAVPQSPQTEGVAVAAHVPEIEAATAQVMAQAEVQAASFDVQSGEPARCSLNHRHGLRYSVQRLEAPGGFDAYPVAINNRGW